MNKAASGGVTALHLAALHGHVDCVHLLIDEHASLAAQTLPTVASPMGSIGAGSTPLHYAACGGEVRCCQASSCLNSEHSLGFFTNIIFFSSLNDTRCVALVQILVSRGADRTAVNCNG